MQVLAKEITVNKLNYNTIKDRINTFINSNINQLTLNFDEDFMPEDLDFLHDILVYENDLDIKFKNLPYCFFKNAEDHIDNTNSHNKVKALSCSACRYNSKCSGTWQEFLSRIDPIKDLPDEIKIELTTRCNLDCSFCLNDRGPDTLTTEDVFSLLDQIKDMGVNAVRITGGEPLVRKDSVSLSLCVSLCVVCSLFHSVCLCQCVCVSLSVPVSLYIVCSLFHSVCLSRVCLSPHLCVCLSFSVHG